MRLTSHSAIVFLSSVLLFTNGCAGSKKKENWTHGFDPDKTAVIVGGRAIPPRDAPPAVKQAILAGNRIVGKPYRRGGGHARIEDSGYDCSGTVSYVLYHAGLLSSPMPSTGFRNYGKRGNGKHITVYAKSGHVFIDIAGLRLDTGYNGARGQGPVWTTKPRPTAGFLARHPDGY